MKPRRTPSSNAVFRLEGGNEDNDLWVRRGIEDGEHTISSVWEISEDERRAIAEGSNIELCVWGDATPPVSLGVTDEPLGRWA